MNFTKTQAIIAFSIFILIGIAYQAFVVVDAGYVGVVKRLGAVKPKELSEGFHIITPFIDSVEKFDIRLSKVTSDATASSKDLQIVNTSIAVQYSMTPELMPLTLQKVGTRAVVERTLIDPSILESVKAITALYTAEELITRRDEVKTMIQQKISSFLNESTEEKNLSGLLIIANVAITDFDFSTEFNRAIEEKVRAEQEALKATNEKDRRVTQAEAQAEEQRLIADALAYEIEVESVARAEAIKREAEALADNPQLIQLRLAEKWDGQLPKFTGETVPFISIDNFDK
ncbi:MAG: prohibitin family protein [Verrucomicrobiota bacterium]|nr:prohibitin family protein [Verrucomicrobiota bacterium]